MRHWVDHFSHLLDIDLGRDHRIRSRLHLLRPPLHLHFGGGALAAMPPCSRHMVLRSWPEKVVQDEVVTTSALHCCGIGTVCAFLGLAMHDCSSHPAACIVRHTQQRADHSRSTGMYQVT